MFELLKDFGLNALGIASPFVVAWFYSADKIAAQVKSRVRGDERFWTFKTPMTDRMQIAFTLNRLKKGGASRLAYFGLEDAYGEAGWNELRKLAPDYGRQIVANERFSRAHTNFTPQALRIRQSGVDAV